MSKKRIILLMLAGLLIFAGLPIFQKFTISDGSTGKLLYIRDLNATEDFYISFIHSVNRTPVEEYYHVLSGRFIVYKTVFKSYGAGMPDPEEGFDFAVEDGVITMSGMDKVLDSFNVFIGTIASHRIFFYDKDFFLSDLAPPKSLLEFKTKRVSLFSIISVEAKGG